MLSFTDVSSCGTATAASLPCMFSPLGREAFDARASTENLLDVLQRAGLAVLWLDNQAGCKGLCERIPNAFTHQLPPGAGALPAGLCDGEECFDEALLHALDKRIAALDPERVKRGVVLVLHQMGSHGPAYLKRSPPDLKPFQPECRSNALQRCARVRRSSTAMTTPSPPPTACWLAPSPGCRASKRSSPRACTTSATTASRSARRASTCTACPTPWPRASRRTCP